MYVFCFSKFFLLDKKENEINKCVCVLKKCWSLTLLLFIQSIRNEKDSSKVSLFFLVLKNVFFFIFWICLHCGIFILFREEQQQWWLMLIKIFFFVGLKWIARDLLWCEKNGFLIHYFFCHVNEFFVVLFRFVSVTFIFIFVH